ncbi:MAG: ABC transporter ATP-binding protein [Desulfarculus sp.]|nr:ABC transporter ATP-binding protein [Desulfarculus sp.]
MVNAVEISGLSFAYNGQPVLEGVDLTVPELAFAAVVGPNGGGKTTLLKLMLGLLTPQRGRLAVLGGPPQEVRGRVGYMPQHSQVDPAFPVAVQDVVLMGRLGAGGRWPWAGRAARREADAALERVGLTGLAARPFHDLSGGQRQRVLIARALVDRPRLLLMDEPTANVDAAAEREVFELLKELNREATVIVVSHDIGFVSPYVGQVICVNRRVVSHPTCDITGEVIAEIYGREVLMVRHDHHLGCRHD